ncbi:uncharacterized protein LOC110986980 isoform X1 [Acanthaster planci]|uniref:Uncharacterized protein LOC110986980 isoform X1 n=1 Tax=Acanthaster planci TaxID=133434 RepID=A0A8B7ZJI1_ACAPL|nr:uncharacterized protein LOC110986980 isoform X1 [Acanthaster planci]
MMENTCTSSMSAYYQQMTSWICRHVRPNQSGISRTAVQVLSTTSCIPSDIHCPSSTRLSKTWARRRSYPKPEYYPDKLVDGICGNSNARSKHREADENDQPICCLYLPGLPFSRWRRRRQAKVAPFIPLSPPIKPTVTSPTAGHEAPAQPKATELSVFDLEDENDQESPSLGLPSRQMIKQDFDEWRRRERRVTHIGLEQDEIQGISREVIAFPPRPKTSRGLRSESERKDRPSAVKTLELSGHEVNMWIRECAEVLNPQTLGSKTINEPGSSNDNLDEEKRVSVKSRGVCDTFEQKELVVTGHKQILANNDTQREYAGRSTKTSKVEPLPPRPKTSRGTRRENGGGDSLSVSSAVRVVEAGLEQAVRDVLVLDTAESLELTNEKRHFSLKDSRGSGKVLNPGENLDEVDDDERNPTHASGRVDEHNTKAAKGDEMAPTLDQVSPPNCAKQNQPITPKSSKNSMDADDMMITAEQEMEYERQQHEQWQLAAIGEWSTLCQDHDEDDYESECYLRMDEFQKETAIMMDWKAIVEQYRTVGVIQDLQNIETLCKSTINQSERALRQFARICRGPVPLSKSGQTKAEAIASLSRIVQKQTRRICEDISNVFSESYQILEELDLLRERQDRVEESLQRDLREKDAEEERSRSSSLSSTATPRLTSSRLQQREIDQDLVDRYMEYPRVKSTSLFNVMPTIYEDKIFQLNEYEEEEEELESDLPECKGMEDVYLHEDDAREHDTAEDDCPDVLLVEELGVKH